jgi:hypothetical protein
VLVPDSLASGAVVYFAQGKGTTQANSALARYAAGGCVYHRFAAVVKTVDGTASCACSLSIPGSFLRLGFSGPEEPASAAVACGSGGWQHESWWANLPVELLRKMQQALQAAEQCAPHGERLVWVQGLGDDAAGVQCGFVRCGAMRSRLTLYENGAPHA